MSTNPVSVPGAPIPLIGCVARPDAEQMRFVLPLRPFISDWQPAVTRFIAGFTNRLIGLSEPGAADWSVRDSDILGERVCRCSIFGGGASVSLSPHELALSFTSVVSDAHQVVFETLARALEFLETGFPSNAPYILEIASVQHADAVNAPSVDTYLAQFLHPGTLQAIERESAAAVEPSVRLLMRMDNGTRIQRVMERSALPQKMLFLSTMVSCVQDVFLSGNARDIHPLFVASCRLADDAVGLRWESA